MEYKIEKWSIFFYQSLQVFLDTNEGCLGGTSHEIYFGNKLDIKILQVNGSFGALQ